MSTVIAVWAATVTTVGVVVEAGQVIAQAVAQRYGGRSPDTGPISQGSAVAGSPRGSGQLAKAAATAVSPAGPDR